MTRPARRFTPRTLLSLSATLAIACGFAWSSVGAGPGGEAMMGEIRVAADAPGGGCDALTQALLRRLELEFDRFEAHCAALGGQAGICGPTSLDPGVACQEGEDGVSRVARWRVGCVHDQPVAGWGDRLGQRWDVRPSAPGCDEPSSR